MGGEVLTPGSPSKDPRLVDSPSNGWTDEKHILFLNSIETSFVDELYNGEYNSKTFLNWLSRLNNRRRSRGQYENDQKSGQLKVLRNGCWENLLDKDNNSTGTENSSATLYANPWIRHFQSPSIKEKHLGSSKRVNDTETIRPSFHQTSEGHDEEATGSKHVCSQDSYSSSIEVSDQNFIDEELVSKQNPSKIRRKRSPGTSVVHNPFNEQAVQHMDVLLKQESGQNHACVSGVKRESSSKASEQIPSLSPSQTKASICNDNQEVHS